MTATAPGTAVAPAGSDDPGGPDSGSSGSGSASGSGGGRDTAARPAGAAAAGGRREPSGRAAGAIGAGRVIALLALFALGFVAYLLVISQLQEARTQDTLYATFRGQLAQEGDEVAPVNPPIADGVPVALLDIPVIGVHQVVLEGTTPADLTRGPGHRRNSVLPGQPGTAVIFGRRASFGGPFRRLPDLEVGDRITTTTGLGVAHFTVSEIRDGRVGPYPLTHPENRLILVTSAPSVAPTHTVIVTAMLTSPVQPAGGALPATASDEAPLAGDPSAALPLVLWGQVLLLAVGATTWLRTRWDGWATWLVAVPVLVAVVWNVYENLARLLPNLL